MIRTLAIRIPLDPPVMTLRSSVVEEVLEFNSIPAAVPGALITLRVTVVSETVARTMPPMPGVEMALRSITRSSPTMI